MRKSSTTRAPARGGKAALLRAVAKSLEKFSVQDLRSLKGLTERRSSGKAASIITAYLPDAVVATSIELRVMDGSTFVGHVNASRSGAFVVVEPQRRATAHAAGKASALDRARTSYESIRSGIVRQSLPLTQAAQRMGLTTEGLSARVDRGQMLAFREHNKKMVPVELIDDTAADHTVRGLSEVIKASTMEPFRLAVWLLNPAESLGERRPIDELHAGNVERVVHAVRGVDAS